MRFHTETGTPLLGNILNEIYPSDKPPAMSGQGKIFAQIPQDTYLAGLWKEDLLQSPWRRTGMSGELMEPENYRAPSWCWSAYDGQIYYSGGSK